MLSFVRLFLVFTLIFQLGSCLRCGTSSVFDHTDFFDCPRPYDRRDETFCCGSAGNTYCCDFDTFSDQDFNDIGRNSLYNFDDAKVEPRSAIKGLAKIVGIVIALIIFVIAICVLCCCCCPFCLIAKRKREGRVLRTNDSQTGTQLNQANQNYPPQSGFPQQSGYPQQPYAPVPGHPNATQPPYPGYAQSSQPTYPPQQYNYPPQPPPYDASSQPQPQFHNEAYQSQPSYNPEY